MNQPTIREFRLSGPKGDGGHAYVNRNGAFLGPGVALLAKDALGRWRPRPQPQLETLLGIGYGVAVDLDWRMIQLASVGRALDKGDLALAAIALVQGEFPPLPDETRAARMAKADGIGKYDPDEPRVPSGSREGGQWASEGDDGTSDNAVGGDGTDIGGSVQPAAGRADELQAKKERFVGAHLATAQEAADKLGLPVEDILGVSALESNWGESRFAVEGNNYFGIHYPAPFASGYILAGDGVTKVATFASYSDGLKSFVAIAGASVRGISNPNEFAVALQNTGKFGVDDSSYAANVSATIRGLRQVLSRHRA